MLHAACGTNAASMPCKGHKAASNAYLALIKPGDPHPAAFAADRHGHAAACLVFRIVQQAVRGCFHSLLAVPAGPLVSGRRMALLARHRGLREKPRQLD